MEGDFAERVLQPGVKGWAEGPQRSERWLHGAVAEDQRQPKRSCMWQEEFSCLQSSWQGFKP